MFREIRRKNQTLPGEICINILKNATNGILSVIGDDGYPYGVPVSFTYENGRIYFHSAKTGHKLDAIGNCDKVCFTVVDKDEIVPEKFTTFFRSVIVFGKARVLTEKDEILAAIRAISGKYSPDESEESREKEIDGSMNAMAIVEITPEHISGKEAIELAKMRV